ncbi:hypothetical protein BU17DRAFT_71509 [Hysterangium stoloniferum]|nr:hypothetical protein BU17DRAFT_71509 [Hysterangium stoloniferum]
MFHHAAGESCQTSELRLTSITSRTDTFLSVLRQEFGEIHEELFHILLFHHREFLVSFSNERLEYHQCTVLLESARWRRGGINDGSGSIGIGSTINIGTGTCGNIPPFWNLTVNTGRKELLLPAWMGKDRRWKGVMYQLCPRLLSPVSPTGKTGSKTLDEYDVPQNDSSLRGLASLLAHDKPDTSLSP